MGHEYTLLKQEEESLIFIDRTVSSMVKVMTTKYYLLIQSLVCTGFYQPGSLVTSASQWKELGLHQPLDFSPEVPGSLCQPEWVWRGLSTVLHGGSVAMDI